LFVFNTYIDITKDTTVQYVLKMTIFAIVTAIVIAPFVLWHFNRPMPIECEYEKGNYILTFKNRTYADRFARINGSEVKMRG
jgi:hypothetical protein